MNPQTSEQTSATPLPPTGDSPGAAIRVAREKAGLSIDDLAVQTRLARNVIDALERDDYGALLEPVYVRGYYRKVAKVLGLSEETLIAAYARRVVPKAPVLPAKLRLGTGADLDPSRRWGSLLVLVVIAVAAVAGIWFLRGERAPMLPPRAALLEQPAVTDPAATPDATASTPAAGPDVAPADAPLSSGLGTQLSSSLASQAPAPAETAPAESAPVAPVPSPPATPAAGPDHIHLTFNAASWASIKDSDGQTLLNGVVRAGEQRDIDGRPPYSVSLGNAPGVQVQYQGGAIDLMSLGLIRESGVARFTLPLPARSNP